MRKTLYIGLECLGLLVYGCLIALPYMGIAFLISLMLASAAVLFGLDSMFALEFLAVGWKVYVIIAILSLPFFTCHWFLDSQAGNFRKYLSRYGMLSLFANCIEALVWPISWATMGPEGARAGSSFAAAVIEVGSYWLIDRKKIKAGKSIAQ